MDSKRERYRDQVGRWSCVPGGCWRRRRGQVSRRLQRDGQHCRPADGKLAVALQTAERAWRAYGDHLKRIAADALGDRPGKLAAFTPGASPSTYSGRTEAMLLVKRLLWIRFLTDYMSLCS